MCKNHQFRKSNARQSLYCCTMFLRYLFPFNSFTAGGDYRRHVYRAQTQRNYWTAQCGILFNVTFRLIIKHHIFSSCCGRGSVLLSMCFACQLQSFHCVSPCICWWDSRTRIFSSDFYCKEHLFKHWFF